MEASLKIDDLLSYMNDARHIQIGCLLEDILSDSNSNS